jgi:hypothetical protein
MTRWPVWSPLYRWAKRSTSVAGVEWDAPLSLSGSPYGGPGGDGYPMPPSGRSSDPLSPYFVDPKIAAITDRHPTMFECVRRDEEIAQWSASMTRHDNDVRRHTAWQGVPPALFVAALGLLIVGQVMLSVAAALAVPVVLAWTALRRRVPPPGFPPPLPLRVRPFDDDENAYLVAHEPPTFFRPVCGCPGCGDVDLHSLLEAPLVMRKCVSCNRVWTQR